MPSKPNRPRRTRNGKRKGIAKSGFPQTKGGTYSYRPTTGPTRALPIPRELSVCLKNTDYFINAASSSYLFQVFGMVEFFGYRPLYCLELYQIYKYARITAVTFELRVTNRSTILPMMMALGTSAFSDASGMTPDRFWEKTTTSRKQLSVQGGLDRGVLRHTFVPQNVLGQPYLDEKFWIDVAQSSTSIPVDVEEPVIMYCVSGLDGGAPGSCVINWDIKYHIQFFDLRTPASSVAARIPDEMEDVIIVQSSTNSSQIGKSALTPSNPKAPIPLFQRCTLG